MRQGNSNKRMRGRGGGNAGRKGPNPLTRTYESTGPDVKIRGTALHIAEKYVSLARDAQSSGDPVLAESYLQHAEHYYRVIAAAQAAMPQPMPVIRSDIQSDDDEDDGDDYAETRFDTRGRGEANGASEGGRGESRGGYDARPIEVRGGESYMPTDAPQPYVDDSTLDRVAGERGEDRRPERGRSRFRSGGRSGDFRPEGGRDGGRPPRERPPRGEGRYEREPREAVRSEAAPREEPVETDLDALPAFLTAAPPRVAATPVAAPTSEVADGEEGETVRRRTRGGRGRGRRADAPAEEASAPEAAAPVSAEE